MGGHSYQDDFGDVCCSLLARSFQFYSRISRPDYCLVMTKLFLELPPNLCSKVTVQGMMWFVTHTLFGVAHRITVHACSLSAPVNPSSSECGTMQCAINEKPLGGKQCRGIDRMGSLALPRSRTNNKGVFFLFRATLEQCWSTNCTTVQCFQFCGFVKIDVQQSLCC